MRLAWRATALAAVACAAAPGTAYAACTPRSNLEAIVDDSGSMSWNDPNNLRIRAMELLIDTQGNEKRTLGAVEFGTDATPLFGPGLIGQNAAAYKAALNADLLADGGVRLVGPAGFAASGTPQAPTHHSTRGTQVPA